MTRLGEFSKITNFFVLMLENRSFDNLFDQSGIPDITHATPAPTSTTSWPKPTRQKPGLRRLARPVKPVISSGQEFRRLAQGYYSCV